MEKEFLLKLINRFELLERELSKPEILKNPENYKSISKEYKELQPVANKAKELLKIQEEMENVEELISKEKDPEIREYLEVEIDELRSKFKKISDELAKLLLPKNPDDYKNCIVEIRAGTGGEEAALFAGDLFKMYSKYAEKKGWKISITDSHETPLGGFKEITFLVEGKGAYGRLKYESGVHRVQRIPVTETGGRIHTSTASVVVLPEAEEVEVDISPEELRIETFRAGGPGGQHVNVTDSAVRITHIPTGITVSCQDERSQHKNRAKALRILRARILDLRRREQKKTRDELRRIYIGTGDRSEKIRTYNFPQRRITDHRIQKSFYNFEDILSGDLDSIIDAIIEEEEKRKLENIGYTAKV
jgi:peptide chain release factor 1